MFKKGVEMQQKVTLESAALDRQWVFPLLTLDVVRPFYNLMGLNREAQAGLQKSLRDSTLATRKQLVEALVNQRPSPTLATLSGSRETDRSLHRRSSRLVGPARTPQGNPSAHPGKRLGRICFVAVGARRRELAASPIPGTVIDRGVATVRRINRPQGIQAM